MKKIDVEEIKKELDKSMSYINEYEKNYLNLFNEIKNSSLLWNDEHSTIFYKRIDNELKNNNMLFDNIKDSYDIKNYLYENYKMIGNKIIYDFEKINNTIRCYDKILDKLDYYMNLINNMDHSFYNSEEIRKINEIIDQFNNIIKKINDSKNGLVSIVNKINNIEDKVKSMLANLEVSNVNTFNMDGLYS